MCWCHSSSQGLAAYCEYCNVRVPLVNPSHLSRGAGNRHADREGTLPSSRRAADLNTDPGVLIPGNLRELIPLLLSCWVVRMWMSSSRVLASLSDLKWGSKTHTLPNLFPFKSSSAAQCTLRPLLLGGQRSWRGIWLWKHLERFPKPGQRFPRT